MNSTLLKSYGVTGRYRLVLVLILFFNLVIGYSKDDIPSFKSKEDSIKLKLKQCKTDTCRYYILLEQAESNLLSNTKKSKYYAKKAFKEVLTSNSNKLIAKAYYIQGQIAQQELLTDSAIIFINKAIAYAQLGNDLESVADYSIELTKLVHSPKDLDKCNVLLKRAESFYYKLNRFHDAYQATSNILWHYQNAGNLDSAIVYINNCIDKHNLSGVTNYEVYYYIMLAKAYKAQSNPRKMLECYYTALAIAEDIDDPIPLSVVYSSIGDYFMYEKRSYGVAREYYNKALDLADTGNTKSMVELYSRMGYIFLEEKKDSIGISYYKKCIELLEGNEDEELVAAYYIELALAFKKNKNYRSAIINFEKGIETFENVSPLILGLLGNCYFSIGNNKMALQYYTQALEKAYHWADMKQLSEIAMLLGEYYQIVGDDKLSEEYYLTALKAAKEGKHIEEIKLSAAAISSYYLSNKNFELAFKYNILNHEMADSLTEIDNLSKMAVFETKFKFDRIKAEKLLAEEEAKREKNLKKSLLIISILLGFIGVIIFLHYKRRTRDNRLLVKQQTELKVKTEALENQRDEIAAQRDEIERVSDILHETDQLKLRFFSNISHEIRTPLTLIINPLKTFLENFSGDTDQIKQLKLIYTNAQKLNDLTNQILDLQKLDTGKLLLNCSKEDVVKVLKDLVLTFQGFADKSNCRLIFSSAITSATCSIDADKICKIVSNLLSNSFKYNIKGGEVRLTLSIANNALNITVSDNGRGIPEEYIKNVFERYYQLKSSNTHHEGTGIGLAYVKELVELMGGNVKIESELSKGTQVNIKLPIHENTVISNKPFNIELIPNRNTIEKRPSIDLSIQNLDDNSISILIVEDNDDLRSFIGEIFIEKFHVIYAIDGEDGVKKACQYLPNIIISDIMMPNVNGIELGTKLKGDIQTSHIPIVFLTAKDNFESQVEGYKTGIDDYIVKPFDSNLLKLKVQNILMTQKAGRNRWNINKDDIAHSSSYSAVDNKFIKSCIQHINKNIANADFSVDALANELAFSRRNLFRKIKALTDFNPAELIRNLRMKHAAHLLKSTNMRVFEVAVAVGYDDNTWFGKTFKKQYGVLPSEYKTTY